MQPTKVDEFQETLERWLDGHREGVSAGGFCEVLQGSTAMSRGVVVITGTSELVAEGVRRRLPAAPCRSSWVYLWYLWKTVISLWTTLKAKEFED